MADQFDPNGKASFLSASVSDKGERERETYTSGWRRHTAPSETNVSANVKTRGTRGGGGEEAEERKRMRKEKGGGREKRTTRFTTMQLDRAFTSFPFLNVCVCVRLCLRTATACIQTRIVFRTVKWKQKATWREGKVRRPASVVCLPWPREPDTRRLA